MPWSAVATLGAAVVGGIASNRAANKAAEASQRAIDANAWQGEIAREQYADYKTHYRPLELQLSQQAQQADTPAAYEQASQEAQASVASQLKAARERLGRSAGFDPTSPAAQAALIALELKGAALGAQEQNRARKQVQDKAWARKFDTLGLGKGLVAGASTGLANASAGAQALAQQAWQQGQHSASGIGALMGGITQGLSKVDWDKWGIGASGAGNGTGVPMNPYGDPVWTYLPPGASGYPDGKGGGV